MTRLALLSLLVLTAGCASSHDGSAAGSIAERMLPSQVSEAALDASGYWLCNPKQRREQARSFDQRYGERVLRPAAKISASGKAKSEYIILPACKRPTRQQRKEDLINFESRLRTIETEFGIGSE
jgi:hypothetical protein